LQQKGENEALRAIALMRQGRIVDLDADLALSAARLGRELGLPLADSVILAAAHKFNASVWTQNSDFEGLEGVRYVAKG
jgi:predicted nucleic acid-binding protein